jgi:small-conductance mechanosensitive channel
MFESPEFFGNTVWAYLAAAGTFLAIVGGCLAARRLGISRLLAQRREEGLRDLMVTLLKKIRMAECGLVAIYFATRHLLVPHRLDRLIYSAALLAVTYRALTMLQAASDYAVLHVLAAKGRTSDSDRGTARGISYLIAALLWTLALLFALSNLGFNVSSMLAGLGIGGVAVALAAQAVLGDLFSAFAIYLDRPFVVGDFIVVGDKQGTVEQIGIKTTRVRSLSGEMLVLANSKLTSADIQNFRQLRERRIVVIVGVPYQTSAEQVRKIPSLLQSAVAAAVPARFDRAHLKAFEPSGFSFELVYYVMNPGYSVYMDVNQAVHLAILDAFSKENIAFALPATVFHQAPGVGTPQIW